MSKKQWSFMLAILVIASMILSACQPAATEAPAPAAPAATEAPAAPAAPAATEAPAAVTEAPAAPTDAWAEVDPSGQTVVFWHQHTREREEALNQIVADFNASNEWGITVEAAYQGSYNDIFNKMLAVLNTTDAPQLVVGYQNQAATYQLAEGLVDMTGMVDSEKWGLSEEDQKDFFPGFWAQDVFPTYGNARLGFPPNRSMEVLYYNAEWLKELGYDAPPTTPEEFKEMACEGYLRQPFSKATVEGSMGYELSIDASRFASFTFAFGGDVFDYNTSKYTYDSEAAVNAMTFLQGMFNEGCATIVTEAYGDQTDFGTGKLLFSVGSSSGLPFYDKASSEGANFEWSVAPSRTPPPDPVMNIYGASVSIPKSTPEGELAAWLFVKYYTGTEAQAIWTKASQYFPVRASVAEGLTDYFAENPAFKTAFDMLPYGRFEPPTPGYDFVRSKVGEAMAAIADGADVAATLKALNEEGNVILAEQMTSPLPTPVPTNTPEPPKPAVKVCQVTDTGGIDDKSFNATAWKGVTDAQEQLGAEGKYLESQQQTDYEKNINAFVEEGCDLIVTVGFLLGDATKAGAEANPEQKFSIVDYAYDPVLPNVVGQVFNTQEAGFLAGYVAAGVSKTGVVGTFGGLQIPPVTVFMDGFVLGVNYYNEVKGTSVQALGWDPATQTGLFTGNFESADDGRTMGENLMDEGADIIMPVAGPVGLGTAAAAQERGNVYIIGVDSDWYLTAPNYASIILTSVLKNMDKTTFQAIQSVQDETFAGGLIVGNLENGGVGLAPFYELESMVPAELLAELEDVKAKLIAGELSAIPQ